MRGLILDLNRNSPIVCFQDSNNTVIHISAYLDHPMYVLVSYAKRHALNMQTELPSGLNLYFSLSLHPIPFFVYQSRGGYVETRSTTITSQRWPVIH